jgi:hypothetical protein
MRSRRKRETGDDRLRIHLCDFNVLSEVTMQFWILVNTDIFLSDAEILLTQ